MTVVQELTALDSGVERAAERLLSLQHPDGWWKGELESNATMIAEHLFLLHFLGLRDAETDRLLANELLARRRDDGTWSIWFEGPADLSVTVEAYTALSPGVDAATRRRTTSAARWHREDEDLHPRVSCVDRPVAVAAASASPSS
jgi:squalene-hopene/tetraprenyl-beta-curcumene cyclase